MKNNTKVIPQNVIIYKLQTCNVVKKVYYAYALTYQLLGKSTKKVFFIDKSYILSKFKIFQNIDKKVFIYEM